MIKSISLNEKDIIKKVSIEYEELKGGLKENERT